MRAWQTLARLVWIDPWVVLRATCKHANNTTTRNLRTGEGEKTRCDDCGASIELPKCPRCRESFFYSVDDGRGTCKSCDYDSWFDEDDGADVGGGHEDDGCLVCSLIRHIDGDGAELAAESRAPP